MDQQLATLVRDARGLDYRVKGWLNLIALRGGTLYASTQTNMADLGIKSKTGYYNWRKAALGSGLMVEQRRFDASTVYIADMELLRGFLPESSNQEAMSDKDKGEPESSNQETMSGSGDDVWALVEEPRSPQIRKLCPDDGESSNQETEDTITPNPIKTPFSRPSSLQGDERASPRSDAKPCGCPVGASCPECRGDAPKVTKYTQEQLRQFHDDHLGRDEKLSPDGTPIDRDRPSSGYQSRRRF